LTGRNKAVRPEANSDWLALDMVRYGLKTPTACVEGQQNGWVVGRRMFRPSYGVGVTLA
jgi:hypothetical protein